jgi:hypothetical protein
VCCEPFAAPSITSFAPPPPPTPPPPSHPPTLQGCTLNEADLCGDPPLVLAAGNGHLAVVKYLLAEGAEPEQRSVMGETALMWVGWLFVTVAGVAGLWCALALPCFCY